MHCFQPLTSTLKLKMEEMKRRSISKTTGTIFVTLFVIFLIYQITLSSIWSSPYTADATNLQELKPEPLEVSLQLQFSGSASAYPAITCDHSHHHYDICSHNGLTLVNPATSTLSLVGRIKFTSPFQNIKLRPYPRKWENQTMSRIKELTLTTKSPLNTRCDVHHNSPALVFSAGGYTGNLFHDFNDGFIPLFITIRTLFFPNERPVLVITNCQGWWLSKYRELIQQFTPHPIINLDNETITHCFPSATTGLISHGIMNVDHKAIAEYTNIIHFRTLLGNAYNMHTNHHFSPSKLTKPRLVLVSRTGDVGRVIRNQEEVIRVAEQTGFEVVLFEPTAYTTMADAYKLINSSHAMLGVHGAALTHFLFLRPGSVFIQIVPIGTDWLSESCFGKPTKEMGVDYMEYKVRVQESCLVEKYGENHSAMKDPDIISKMAFDDFKNIYLKKQDVKLDLARIGGYLRKAYVKAKSFICEDG